MTAKLLAQLLDSEMYLAEGAVLAKLSAKTVERAQGVPVPLRTVMLVTQGVCHLMMEGGAVVLARGCYTDIDGRGTGWRLLSASDDVQGYLFAMEFPFILEVFKNRPPFDNRYLHYMEAHRMVQMPEDVVGKLCGCFETLGCSMADVGHMRHLMLVEMKTLILYMEIANYFEHSVLPQVAAGSCSDRVTSLMLQLMELVQLHAKTEHTVDFYAARLCISPQYLGRIVQRMLHYPVSRLITDAVVTESKMMLTNPSLTLKDIVSEMRFSDQSVFTKFFKRNTGMTPLQYRNSLK